jgi:hypothetical protein
MKLLILDNSYYPINFETEEFVKQLGKSNVTIFSQRSDIHKNTWFSDIIKKFDPENFIQEQSKFNAVYITNTQDNLEGIYKIPYFFNIYAHTWNTFRESEYKVFQDRYSQLKGAGAVFVNDKLQNKYCHWLGLNSYFLNKPINTYIYKFDKSKKFITPKLNIGFVPSQEPNSERNKIFKQVLELSKSNWIFHIPDGNILEVDKANLIRHKIANNHGSESNFSEIFKHSHLFLNPEDPRIDFQQSFEEACVQSMACGNIVVKTNFHNNNSETFFDNVHYLKMDSLDIPHIIENLKYADKRREKLWNMSRMSSEYIYKYFDVRSIVQYKLMIIKNSI